ncbi:MAG: hypothetical protein AMXMBFR34_46850 [Myxococcaceae bacterium]
MGWKPVLAVGVDLKSLPLSPLHGFVLSRVDGASDVEVLSKVTGLPVDRVQTLLDELVATGALQAPPAAATGASSPLEAGSESTSTPAPPDATSAGASSPLSDAEESDASADAAPEEPPAETADEPAAPDDAAPAAEPEPGTHRQLFEAELHGLTADERGVRAQNAVEPYLSALCFDPLPSVVQALLDNPQFGLQQARLVARHHRNPNGLEALAGRAAFAADGQVRRLLLHNPMLPGSLYRRLWTTRRMLEQHQVLISREVPEQTRRAAREVLRTRFTSGPSEEKAELIVKTEGRCLAALVGLPLDGKTTSLLCQRTYASVLFVQNLARWSAAPPQLIAHLQRQDVVKRNGMLRTLLDRHPNAPKGHV